jgi:hypothetical protein
MNKSLLILVFAMLLAGGIVEAANRYTATCSGTTIPSSGNWTIAATTTCSNGIISLENANISSQWQQTLILNNVTLIFNMTTPENNNSGIVPANKMSLSFNNVNITVANSSYKWYYKPYIWDGTIYNLNYTTFKYVKTQGLRHVSGAYPNTVLFDNAIIKDSDTLPLLINGFHRITVKNSQFQNISGDAVYFQSAENTSFINDTFIDKTFRTDTAIALYGGAYDNLVITQSNFINWSKGIGNNPSSKGSSRGLFINASYINCTGNDYCFNINGKLWNSSFDNIKCYDVGTNCLKFNGESDNMNITNSYSKGGNQGFFSYQGKNHYYNNITIEQTSSTGGGGLAFDQTNDSIATNINGINVNRTCVIISEGNRNNVSNLICSQSFLYNNMTNVATSCTEVTAFGNNIQNVICNDTLDLGIYVMPAGTIPTLPCENNTFTNYSIGVVENGYYPSCVAVLHNHDNTYNQGCGYLTFTDIKCNHVINNSWLYGSSFKFEQTVKNISIIRGVANNSFIGVWISHWGNGTKFINLTFGDNLTYSVHIENASSTVFVNPINMNKSKFDFSSKTFTTDILESKIYVKWWRNFNITNNGAAVNGANVSLSTSMNDIDLYAWNNLTTDATGITPVTELAEYKYNNTGQFNYTNWTVTIKAINIPLKTYSLGFTSSGTTTYEINSAPSTPTLNSPILYSNYSRNWVILNYSSTDIDGDNVSCYFYTGTGAFTLSLNASGVNCSNFNLTGIPNGKLYHLAKATDTYSNSSNSSTSYFTVDTTPPNPSSVSNNNSNPKINEIVSLNATWTDATTNLKYYWFWSNLTGINTTPIAFTSSYSFKNLTINLTRGNTIGWKFYANDTVNNINETVLQTFTVANTNPATPSLNSPASGINFTTTSIILNYSYSDVDGDNVSCFFYTGTSITSLSLNATANCSNFNLEGLYPATFYHLTKATDTYGNSSNSSISNFTMYNADVTAPSITNIQNHTIGIVSAKINFTVDESSNYTINYTDGITVWTIINSSFGSGNKETTLTGLTSNTPYQYFIKACDVVNNCNTSSTYQFTTLSETYDVTCDINTPANNQNIYSITAQVPVDITCHPELTATKYVYWNDNLYSILDNLTNSLTINASNLGNTLLNNIKVSAYNGINFGVNVSANISLYMMYQDNEVLNYSSIGNYTRWYNFTLPQNYSITQAYIKLNPLQTQLYYDANANSFNMTDGCRGKIALEPNAAYPLEICLQNSSGSDISGTCITYTSGNYSDNQNIYTSVFNTSLLTNGQSYRLKFNWKRINYVAMNNSALNGFNDSGGTTTGSTYSRCVASESGSTVTSSCGIGDRFSNFQMGTTSDCLDTSAVNVGSYFYLYTSSDCSGNAINLYSEGYNHFLRSQNSQVQRIYEGGNLKIGTTASGSCVGVSKDISSVYCDCGSYTTKYIMTSCTNGTDDSSPSSLCTYAGDYTDYSSYFTYSLATSYSSNFNDKLKSTGYIYVNPVLNSSIAIYVNNTKIYNSSYQSSALIDLSLIPLQDCYKNGVLCDFELQSDNLDSLRYYNLTLITSYQISENSNVMNNDLIVRNNLTLTITLNSISNLSNITNVTSQTSEGFWNLTLYDTPEVTYTQYINTTDYTVGKHYMKYSYCDESYYCQNKTYTYYKYDYSVSYQPTVTANSYRDYIITINNTGIDILNSGNFIGTLTYNNTIYAATLAYTENLSTLSVNLLTPQVPSPSASKTFNFNYTMAGNNLYSQDYSQTILILTMDNCIVYNESAITFNIWNEDDTDYPLMADMELYVEYWTIPTEVYNYSFLYSGNSTYSLCTSVGNNTIYSNVYAFYTVDTGFTHRYILYNYSLSNVTQNIDMFNFNYTTGLSDLKGTTRYKNSYLYFPNVVASLQRRYVAENVWRVVQMDESDDFGQLFFNIKEENTDYRVVFKDRSNHVLQTTNSMKFICTSGVCDLTFLVPEWSGLKGATNLTISYTYSNSTGVITVNWNDPTGFTNSVRTLVTKELGGRRVDICNKEQTGTAGTATCNVSSYQGDVLLRVFSSASPEIPVLFKWITVKLSQFIGNIIPFGEAALWSFGLSLTIIMAGATTASAPIVVAAGVASLLVVSLLHIFIPLTVTIVTIAIILGVIISLKVSK